MPQIRAVVFDLDGTLLNTLEHIVQAFEKVAAEHGQKVSRDKILAIIGPPLVDCYRLLLPEHDSSTSADRHHSIQQTDEFMELIQEYSDLHMLLDALKAKGLKIAIFTNRWRRGVDLIFGKLGLGDEFDLIITPESVKKGKPDPEGLCIIAKKLNLDGKDIAMVGDMIVDIEAGKAAGAGMTVGITHGFGSREQLEEAGADYVVDSLTELAELFLGKVR